MTSGPASWPPRGAAAGPPRRLDVSYYLIRLLACAGLVWDVRTPSRAKLLG